MQVAVRWRPRRSSLVQGGHVVAEVDAEGLRVAHDALPLAAQLVRLPLGVRPELFKLWVVCNLTAETARERALHTAGETLNARGLERGGRNEIAVWLKFLLLNRETSLLAEHISVRQEGLSIC